MCRSRIAVWIATACLSGILASCATDGNDPQETSEGSAPPSPASALQDSVLPGEDGFSAYAAILGRLEVLVERGRRETRRMGDRPQRAAPGPGFSGMEAIVLEDTRCEWADDLVLIEGSVPEKPALERDSSLALVHENIARALAELHRMPLAVSSGTPPPKRECEMRLDRAEVFLFRARRALEAASR